MALADRTLAQLADERVRSDQVRAQVETRRQVCPVAPSNEGAIDL
jgi:hypothetical protein